MLFAWSKQNLCRLLVVLLGLATVLPSLGRETPKQLWTVEGADRRFALVIGSKSYGDTSQKHTLNDTRAMAAKLRQLHFDVSELKYLDAWGVSLPEVFRKVRVSVKKLSHPMQVTAMEDRLDEPLVLVPVQEPDPAHHKPNGVGGNRPTRINSKDGAQAVYISAGEFLMGTSDAQVDALLKLYPSQGRDWYEDEQPQHRVYLDGYWLYKNLVTVGEYRKFCTATGRQMPDAPPFNANWSKEDHPIVNVSWADAEAYAKWAGGALPTEAQWEKGARGRDGWLWPWGNTWDESKVWRSKIALGDAGGTHSVGELGVSPCGCTDMAGNVWEWCKDWHAEGYYGKSISKNPTGPGTGSARVLRGGSWYYYYSNFFRTAVRLRLNPSNRNMSGGFRVVLP